MGDFYWHLSDLYTTGLVSLRVPGDTDGDGDVDAADLVSLLQNWSGIGEPCLDPTLAPLGDFDADCDVDAADLTALLAYWTGFVQVDSISPSSVPEPSMMLELAWLGLALITYRHRQNRSVRKAGRPG